MCGGIGPALPSGRSLLLVRRFESWLTSQLVQIWAPSAWRYSVRHRPAFPLAIRLVASLRRPRPCLVAWSVGLARPARLALSPFLVQGEFSSSQAQDRPSSLLHVSRSADPPYPLYPPARVLYVPAPVLPGRGTFVIDTA